MSGDLKSRLELVRVVLRELSHGPFSRTDLEKRCRGSMSYACFVRVFVFLREDGDVEKGGLEHRALYRITEKGRAFLAWRALS